MTQDMQRWSGRTALVTESLTPEDVARAVRFVLSSPPHVQFHDLLDRPTRQPS